MAPILSSKRGMRQSASRAVARKILCPMLAMQARLCVLPDGVQDDSCAVPGGEPNQPQTAIVCYKLPPWQTYMVKATFPGGVQAKTCFADLPLAEPAEFTSS